METQEISLSLDAIKNALENCITFLHDWGTGSTCYSGKIHFDQFNICERLIGLPEDWAVLINRDTEKHLYCEFKVERIGRLPMMIYRTSNVVEGFIGYIDSFEFEASPELLSWVLAQFIAECQTIINVFDASKKEISHLL